MASWWQNEWQVCEGDGGYHLSAFAFPSDLVQQAKKPSKRTEDIKQSCEDATRHHMIGNLIDGYWHCLWS
jgi:hypothetical protein